MIYVFLLIFLFLVLFVFLGIKIVPQSEEYIVQQFGRYKKTLKPGLHFIIPLFEKVTHKVFVLETQLPTHSAEVITKDNVQIKLQTAIFYRVINAEYSVFRIQDVKLAVITTVTSVVRSTAGHMEFDEVQSRRDYINEKIKEVLAEACIVWGIQITRTEILDVDVDSTTRAAMQQQLNAERERRAQVTHAEGEKLSAQLKADAVFYTAQREAQGVKVRAEADAYATEIIGKAIAQNGQAAVDFEIRKQQITAIADLGKSNNTKLIVLPTDVTKTLGSIAATLEAIQR
jgi:regulator of protease activity HflC (stomatin/prohibitin superfamily)